MGGPQIVALDIIFSFQFAFILFLAYFHFRSVLRNLQASSGKTCEALRAPQHQLYWRYIETLLELRYTLHLKAKRSDFSGPIGKAREFAAPIISFCGFFLFDALRLLAEYESQRQQYWRSIKETKEYLGEARTPFRCASPIVIEIAYYFRFTDRKRNYVQYETTANKKIKIMPSARVRGQCPTNDTFLDSPQFSLDTIFKRTFFRKSQENCTLFLRMWVQNLPEPILFYNIKNGQLYVWITKLQMQITALCGLCMRGEEKLQIR